MDVVKSDCQTEPVVRDGSFVNADGYQFEYHQKSNPKTSNLDLLTYGTYRIMPDITSDELFHRTEEALLFCVCGSIKVNVLSRHFTLSHYDTLYIPVATPYTLENVSTEKGLVVACKAYAKNKHEPFYSSWEKFSKDEKRIRCLKKKKVYIMFDVTEKADRLIAGYTIYEPYTRAHPVHRHSDQEEVYIFTKGRGAMEVYAAEENKTFVTSVKEMDAVTIPVLNYHPVFSQEEELHFIWCIAGERYWVGDKNKDLMSGNVDKLTT